jgi:hypothetical protein
MSGKCPNLHSWLSSQSIFECTRVRLNQVYNYFSLAVLYLSGSCGNCVPSKQCDLQLVVKG